MTPIAEREKMAKLILAIDDDAVIKKIRSVLTSAAKTARGKYIEQYNKDVDAATKRMDNGEYYTHEQVNGMITKRQKELSIGIKKRRKIS